MNAQANAITVQDSRAVTPVELIDRALSQGASAEMIEKLMTLQERWEKNQARKEYDAAVAEAKAKIPAITRNRTGHNDKRYADFAAIAKVVDPVLSEFGLSYRFRTSQTDRINVTCILAHRAGHCEETTLSGPADTSGNKNAIQAIGSTLSYLQRYSLVQMLGLAASDDDDGKAAGQVDAITMEQAQELLDIINKAGADVSKFCKAFRIDAVPDLPAKRFEEAKQRLAAFNKNKGA